MTARAIPLVVLAALFGAAAAAQSAERAIANVKAQYDAANYDAALRTAGEMFGRHNFTDEERIELNKYAGAAAFNLGQTAQAEELFFRVLQINPDYVLDPFAFPPPAVRFFEELKRKNGSVLDQIRTQIALREAEARRQVEERERARAAAEEQRRRLEQLARQVTVRTVEKRSFGVNFVPFGAGQFQQGRTTMGVALAAGEGALAVTSVIAYLAQLSMLETETLTYDDLLGTDGPVSVTVRRIPESRMGEADAWRLVQYLSGAGFYLLYAYGVFDALYHHQDEAVSEEVIQLDTPRRQPSSLNLFPTPGGVGAGFTSRF